MSWHIQTPILRSGPSHQRLGMTLVEVMIASSIMVFVFLALTFLQIASARSTKTNYSQARSQTERQQAIDQMRYTIMMARIGSATVLDNGRTIQYNNPNLGPGITSSFFYENETLFYDEDIADADAAVIKTENLDDVWFEVIPPGATVVIHVSNTNDLKAFESIIENNQIGLFLRN